MKKSIFTLTAGVMALAASAAIAGHHEGDKKMSKEDYKAKMEAKTAERFAAMDTDGSGTVSKAEYMAAKAAEAEKDWAKGAEFLGDDGEASLEEVMAYQAAMKAEKKAKHKAMKEGKKDM